MSLRSSIGKKLVSLIIIAFAGIALLLMTGFYFFGKIGEISNVSRAGYVYEVTFYQARAGMSDFLQTWDPGALEEVKAGIAKMIQLDVSLGHLKDSFPRECRPKTLWRLLRRPMARSTRSKRVPVW